VSLGADRPVRIGRSRDNDLVLDDPHVSGLHAEVRLRDGEVWVLDRGSRNGTLVHGRPVGGSGVRLRVGDVVEIGELRVRLQAVPKVAPPPADEPPYEGQTLSDPVTISVSDTARIALGRPAGEALRGSPEYLLALLRRGGELARGAPGPEALLERLLHTGLEAAAARRGAAFLAGPDGPAPVAFRAKDDPDVAAFPVPIPLVERVISLRSSILVEGVPASPASGQLLPREETSAVCLPVGTAEEALGALYFEAPRADGTLGARDLELLTVLGTQAGLIFQQQRLLRRSAYADQLAILREAVVAVADDLDGHLQQIRTLEHQTAIRLEEAFPLGLPPDWLQLREAVAWTWTVVHDLREFVAQDSPEWRGGDPTHTVSSAISALETFAQEQGVGLADASPPCGVTLYYDPAWLLRAVTNLIRHALLASPEGTCVRVQAELEAGGVWFTVSVADRGPGPPASENGNPEGRALSLTIAQRIAIGHGGELVLAPREGGGTRATLRIPARDRRPEPTLPEVRAIEGEE